ncbi:sensor histidine kinase [Paenibacillus qinlingensis]|uniref:sensor histidine kinase n=1 Tax=Paenibacillus qinlingensis TaxID=1837343 RepID=UPI00156486C3|nr:histidine kinase [Paenibacillus qinlingensis]NQX60087.1 histidine kinase [Paenibacillus qinlingensis]
MNLIKRVILLIVMSLVVILALYAYSYKQSIKVIENQINTRNEEKLSYFLNRIESLLDQNMIYATLVTKDPEIKKVAYGELPPASYDRVSVVQSIESKLNLFSMTNQIMNIITLYFPKINLALSTVPSTGLNQEEILRDYTANWKLTKVDISGVKTDAFSRFFVSPYHAEPADIMKSDFIIRVDFFTKNIANLLDEFKLAGNGDAFFYGRSDQIVYNSTANMTLIQQLMQEYPFKDASEMTKRSTIVELSGKKYILYVLPSEKLNWSLVDIEPLEEILNPVNHSRNLFYIILFLLLLLGMVAAYFLYFYIQVPIRILIRSSEHIKNKNFAYRIQSLRKDEFRQLFDSFNDMAKEIDELIKRVYAEEIRSREAVMKQLQSQINPHFLYNCLAYIVNMAKMNKNQSVIAMAHNLGDYYKYTTRNETLETTLGTELELAVNYMNIMNQQLDKFRYIISVPETMKAMKIPKLMIQPLIENAIVHGLEEISMNGIITIVGLDDGPLYRLIIEDNGPGLSEEALTKLRLKTEDEHNDSPQKGVWNVYHRFHYYFGQHSRMRLDNSALGGLRIELSWEKAARE